MAEKEIGLRIRLNGLSAVVKDITTFENEIRKAKEDLKQVEIGSKVFQELSQEIGLAESQLLSLIQSTKRLTKERQIEGIGKLGQGVASSFAAATAAVSLFGSESEDVQKAATAAQNLLTLALSARGIAEVKLGAQLVARTIAEKAATAATAAQGTALEGLYVIMAANPYGVIIAAIGALVAAYAILGSSEDEQIEKTKTLNELRVESAVAAESESKKIELLTQIINDNNVQLIAREGAYRQLQKLVPELTNLSLKEALSIKSVTGEENKLNEAIKDQITLIKLRAEQKALESFIEQQTKKDVEKSIKQREQYIKGLSVEINQLQVRLAKEGLSNEIIQEQVDFLIARKTAGEGLLDVNQQLRKVTEQIVGLEEKQNKTIEKTKNATKDLTKEQNERKKSLEALTKLLSQQIKLESDLLFQTFKLGDADAQITKELTKRVDKANELAKSLDKVKSFSELLIDVEKELLPINDEVGNSFISATLFGEDFFNTLNDISKSNLSATDKQLRLNTALKDYQGSITEIRNTGTFTPEQLQALSNVQLIYEDLVKSLNKFVDIKPTFDTAEWEKEIVNFALATGQILTDPFERTEEERKIAVAGALQAVQKTETEFIASFIAYEKDLRKETIASYKGDKEALRKLEEELTELGKSAFNNLQKQGIEILKFEDGVRRVNIQAKELNKTLTELAPIARRAFIVSNAEEIAKQYGTTIPLVLKNEKELANLQNEISKKTYDDKKRYGEAINILTADLKAQDVDIEKLSYEEKLVLLEKFLKKSVDAEQNASDDQDKKRKKRFDQYIKDIEMFVSFVGQVESLYQQSIQLKLEGLDKANKKALESVVGDTEEANQKRIELTKQYETQKAALEKEALIKSLQYQKLQAAASLATAALSTFGDLGYTPQAFLLVGIGTALAAVQIGLIQEQLAQARSMAGGGMIFGASHEMGGVMAGGGYNLEGGESVINKQSTVQYGSLLSSINQMGGGKAIVNSQQNGLMEERLLQAFAKTKSEPIRAYVMNSEITNGQAINRRLSELATV